MIVAIIQARMGSTRLPGKVMKRIAGKPMLWHVVRRVQAAASPDTVVVATSTEPADDVIAELCQRGGFLCYRGSEQDVLARYHDAAQAYEADVVVRVTADCPMIDPDVIDLVVEAFLCQDVDYASNVKEPTFPDGLCTEVFTADALARAYAEATWQSEREHVTPYIHQHPDRFRLAAVRQERDLSALRWTVDEPADLAFVRAVVDALAGEGFGPDSYRMQDVLDLLDEQPELLAINQGIGRNEGYATSLNEDRRIG